MAVFLLVHGAWQAGWVWDDVAPLLRRAGHDVLAVDLPGHGADPTPPPLVTGEMYVDALQRAIDASLEPPIIVGHSNGGTVLQLADRVPDRLRAVVYVAAIVPANGTAMFDVVLRGEPDYLAQFVMSADGRVAGIRGDGARRYLYPFASESAASAAIARLTAEPVAPFQEPIVTSGKRGQGLPTYYVETRRDPVIPLAIQKEMQSNAPVTRVLSLETDHSPFLCAPEELTALFLTVAAETSR